MVKQVVKLGFDKSHAEKLLRGGAVQMSPAHLCGERGATIHVIVSKPTHTKMRKAVRDGKSMRIRMSDLEDSAEGGSIADFFRKVKEGFQKAGQFLKEKVIDTPFYQEQIRPKVKQGLQAAVQSLVPAAAQPFAQKAVSALGEATGAAGISAYPVMYGGAVMPVAFMPWSNYSQFAGPAAMVSKQPYMGFGLPGTSITQESQIPKPRGRPPKGGSFRAI